MKLSELKTAVGEITELKLLDFMHIVKNGYNVSYVVSQAKLGAGTGTATAHAGGGQASATTLEHYDTKITVCATDHDSVKPVVAALKDYRFKVRNHTSKIVDIYPLEGDNFEGKAADEPIELAPDSISEFVCFANGEWTI